MREQKIQDLLVFETDHKWVNEHKEALLKQYAEQWIAVKNGQVIASDYELSGLRVSKILCKLDPRISDSADPFFIYTKSQTIPQDYYQSCQTQLIPALNSLLLSHLCFLSLALEEVYVRL